MKESDLTVMVDATEDGARSVPLDTSANSFSAGYRERRRIRMERRSIAQAITHHRRLEDCGRVAYGSGVALRLTDGVAGIAGVATCGSVWACSVCSAKIANRRSEELSAGLAKWWTDGGDVAMLTLTMRHTKKNRLESLWDALSYAWNGVTSGRQWQTEKAQHNLAGWVRVVEITEGRRGWHVHIHALLLLRPRADVFGSEHVGVRDFTHWKARIVQRWADRLDARGFSCVDEAQDMRMIAVGDRVVADYVNKSVDHGNATAREMTWGQSKTARAVQNRTPFGILDDLIAYGEAHDAALWQEYVDASQGRRQMTWAKGTRDLLGIGVEQTDEDIAAEETGTADDDMVLISAAEWWRLSASGTAVSRALDALELWGIDGCLELLAEYGISASRATGERRGS